MSIKKHKIPCDLDQFQDAVELFSADVTEALEEKIHPGTIVLAMLHLACLLSVRFGFHPKALVAGVKGLHTGIKKKINPVPTMYEPVQGTSKYSPGKEKAEDVTGAAPTDADSNTPVPPT